MRGSTSDFYALAPGKRMALQHYPPDFDPAAIARYAGKPLAPEIRECEGCKLSAACRPGQWARAECRERDVDAGPVVPRQDVVLAALGDGQRHTVRELEQMTGVNFKTIHRTLDKFKKAGLVANAQTTNRRYGMAVCEYWLVGQEAA